MKLYRDQLLMETLTLGNAANYTTVYTYNELGQITKEVTTGDVERVIDYTYDANENIVKQVITVEEHETTITKTYTYDEHSNIASVITTTE